MSSVVVAQARFLSEICFFVCSSCLLLFLPFFLSFFRQPLVLLLLILLLNVSQSLIFQFARCGFLHLDQKLLGAIFRLMENGISSAQELKDKSNAANRGVVYNNINILKCITEGSMPTGSSISRYSLRAIERLSRDNKISEELKLYFNALKEKLRENAESLNALKFDQEVLDKESEKLSVKADQFNSAIYVYSFPTYIQNGTLEDSEVMWLKVGSTKNSVWRRVLEQTRQTSMPEDPKLLRIYHKEKMNIDIYYLTKCFCS
jgi:hypothetical protein